MYRFLSMVFFVGLLPVGALRADYEWRTFPDDADQVSLWRDGRQLGNYRFSTREYFPRLDPGSWGDACRSPYPLPGANVYPATVEADGTLNYGLDLHKMPPAGKHVLNGKEVSKEELLKALAAPRLSDDSGWLSVTLIGSDAARRQVLADLRSAPALAPWKDRIKVQDYPPDHWAVKDAGFRCDGNPTIYCQASDGKVLHRQDNYRGPDALAEVLREADPAYRPEKDPDLNRTLPNVPPLAFLLGGAILLFLVLKGEKR